MKAKGKKKKENENEIFGKNVKYERKKQKRTQKEVAFASDITPQYLSEIENNKTSLTLSLAVKISKTLKVNLGDLIKQLD